MVDLATSESSLAHLTDGQLCMQLRSGVLSEMGAKKAIDLLLERGWVPADIPAPPIMEERRSLWEKLNDFIADCAAGRASLMHAMWALGGLIGLANFFLFFAAELSRMTPVYSIFMMAWVCFIFLGNPFHGFCVWRCARNTKGYALGQLARIYAAGQLLFWGGLTLFFFIISIKEWFYPTTYD